MDPISTLVLAWLYLGEINESETELPASRCTEAAAIIEAEIARRTGSPATKIILADGTRVPVVAAQCHHVCYSTAPLEMLSQSGAVTIIGEE